MKMFEVGSNSITLYRGLSPNGLTSLYNHGTFYTELESYAQRYTKGSGKIDKITFSPKKTFNIDQISVNMDLRKKILSIFKSFLSNQFPDLKIEDTQLYENLVKGDTDFPYPTEADTMFLKSRGYDSVYFSKEGGQLVKTWYIIKD